MAKNRMQTGVRMDKKLIKVLKGLAEYYEVSLGELLEFVVAKSLCKEQPYDDTVLKKAQQLMGVYNLTAANLKDFHISRGDDDE